MPDREKVIYDIERCICHVPDACRDCSHYKELGNAISCMEELLSDALALLKEQETVVHALDILRANGWKQEEPVCAHCEAVHVVLCKDCKHRLLPKGETRAECMARAGWFPVDDDWFCADGERK